MFSDKVCKEIGIYVYRLIDPRNGETFYVGKGRNNRVFQHANGNLTGDTNEDCADLKIKRIKDIQNAGLEVIHVIHRHAIKDDEVAYQIEAALIDAYPGLTNVQSGHDSGDYGCRHANQIIREYSAEEFKVKEPLILISINRSFDGESGSQDVDAVYECVRAAWVINPIAAIRYRLVLAHFKGIVRGAYRPNEWLQFTKENFPRKITEEHENRYGFVGDKADDVWGHYVGKRIPERYRRPGAANPIRYVDYPEK